LNEKFLLPIFFSTPKGKKKKKKKKRREEEKKEKKEGTEAADLHRQDVVIQEEQNVDRSL